MAEIIAVNQSGYAVNGTKRAALNFQAGTFNIKNEADEIVYSGNARHFGEDAASGDDVYIADFSNFTKPGKYRICADNIVYSQGGPDTCGAGLVEIQSYEFSIDDDKDKDVLDKLCKAYYYLRCGMDLEEKYAGKFVHKACHCGCGKIWTNPEIEKAPLIGGWHDAGDYGRYTTAGAVAVAHLLYAYIFFPEVFDKQCLNIPESGKGMPDILAEVKYELEWLHGMQLDDGAAYHKLTTAHHAPFCMPEEDKAQLYYLPVSSFATADLAAVNALAARVYAKYDVAFADKCRAVAEKSGEWLIAHPEFIRFDNPEGCGTGGYGEWGDDDNRFWAACELYALTGEAKWQEMAEKILAEKELYLTALGYGHVAGLGALAILTAKEHTFSDKTYNRCKDAYINHANSLKEKMDDSGYGCTLGEKEFYWGSNSELMKRGMIFAIADILDANDDFIRGARAQADVLLGVNPMNFSYVSGVGTDSMQNPHLRPTAVDGIDECIPGFVSGGPNGGRSCPAAKAVIPEGTKPMKCYADIMEAYSLNEITIYWNSPAVFLWAYLVERHR